MAARAPSSSDSGAAGSCSRCSTSRSEFQARRRSSPALVSFSPGVRTLRLAVRLRRRIGQAGPLAVLRPAAGALPLRLALDDDGARPRRRRALLPPAHPQPRRGRGRRPRRRVSRPRLAELHDRAGRAAAGRSDGSERRDLLPAQRPAAARCSRRSTLLAGPFGAQLGMLAFAAAAAAAGLAAARARYPSRPRGAARGLDDPRLRPAAAALCRTVLGRGPRRPARRPDLPWSLARLDPARRAAAASPSVTTRWELLALALPLVALPLLKLRFLALALPLGALAIARLRGSGRRRRELLLLAAATLLGLGLWNFWRYGNPLRMYAGSDLAIFAVPAGRPAARRLRPLLRRSPSDSSPSRRSGCSSCRRWSPWSCTVGIARLPSRRSGRSRRSLRRAGPAGSDLRARRSRPLSAADRHAPRVVRRLVAAVPLRRRPAAVAGAPPAAAPRPQAPGRRPALALRGARRALRRRSRSSTWSTRPGPTVWPTAPAGCSTSSPAARRSTSCGSFPPWSAHDRRPGSLPLVVAAVVLALGWRGAGRRRPRVHRRGTRFVWPAAAVSTAARLERSPRRCPGDSRPRASSSKTPG